MGSVEEAMGKILSLVILLPQRSPKDRYHFVEVVPSVVTKKGSITL
ncbi:hypothetical protein ACFLUU_05465 [Chloroflexota bacterium]